jgi:hypothetical protein
MIPAAKFTALSSPAEDLAQGLDAEAHELSDSLSRWGVRTALLITGASLVRLLILATTQIANGEAYYYVWSRFPSWSYYDHPPMVAWMAWLTTRFAQTDFFIRAGPVACSALFAWLLYRLTERLFSPRAGFIAVALVTILPVFFITSYALNPESPLAPLWVLFLLVLEGMRRHDESWRPLAAGLVVGAAFLAKYSAVLLAVVGLSYVVVSPPMRRWLTRPSLYLGGVIAIVGALPVIGWNFVRQWPSLTLHFVERKGPSDPVTLLHNASHAFLGQFGPFHPLLFPALLVTLAIVIQRSRHDDRFRFLALASWPVLLFFLAMMVRVRDPESHWTMVGYIPLAIAAGGLLDEMGSIPRALRWYLGLSVAVSVIAIAGMYTYSQAPGLRRFLPAALYDGNRDFFNEMVGWDELRGSIESSAAALGGDTVVASCQYALCSHILKALDDQPTVYCPGVRRTEFDFIGRRDPPAKVPVLYVTDDHYHDDPALLFPDRDCHPLRVVSIERDGVVMQNYRLSACLSRE